MNKRVRTIVALLLGSLSSMVPVTLGALYEGPDGGWIILYLYLGGLGFTLSALAYLTLVLLPAHLLLVKRGWDRWWVYPLIGGVFALAAFTVFDLWTGGWSPRELPIPVIVGVLSSLTFWAVLRPRTKPR